MGLDADPSPSLAAASPALASGVSTASRSGGRSRKHGSTAASPTPASDVSTASRSGGRSRKHSSTASPAPASRSAGRLAPSPPASRAGGPNRKHGSAAASSAPASCVPTAARSGDCPALSPRATYGVRSCSTAGPEQQRPRQVATSATRRRLLREAVLRRSGNLHHPNCTPGSPPMAPPLLFPPTTLIVGDSIIRNIRFFNATTKCFPGATTSKIMDMLPNLLQSLPSSVERAVLHVGTNDVAHGNSEQVKEHFKDLFKTWQKPDVFSALNETCSNGFCYLQRARTSGRGGGLAVIHRSDLYISSLPLPELSSFECLAFKCKPPVHMTILFIYRLPKPNPVFITEMYNLLSIFCTTSANLIILGDLNLHVDSPSCHSATEFLQLLDCFNLTQLVDVPTHTKGHTLDLVITDSVPLSKPQAYDLGVSDHKIIYMEVLSPSPLTRPQHQIRFRNLKNINPASMFLDLQHLLPVNFSTASDAVDFYNKTLSNILDHHAPTKTRLVSFSRTAPWYNSQLHKMKTAGRVLERRFKATGLTIHSLAYREHQKAYSKSLREARSLHFSKIINNNPGHSKQLFSTVNHLLNPQPPLRTEITEEYCNKFMVFFKNKIDSIRSGLSGSSILPAMTTEPQTVISHPLNSFPYVGLREAANPGCVLEDFVRWYSPRDYVEEEVADERGNTVVKGELSARMKIPGNMWVEAWETARVTPARRQRRLFDDTKEAEKTTKDTEKRIVAETKPNFHGGFQVLHYLALQKSADLTRHLLPCILHAAILKLKEEESIEDIPSVKQSIKQATCQASKLLQPPNHDYKKLEDFINQLMAMETVITQARSLKAKFAICEGVKEEGTEDLEKFVISLLEEPEVVVTGAGQGPAGSIIHRLFVNAQRKRVPLVLHGLGEVLMEAYILVLLADVSNFSRKPSHPLLLLKPYDEGPLGGTWLSCVTNWLKICDKSDNAKG
ncbi:Rab3 GTPase-activating protein catalytic subunit [Nibea albiflora]|uniref:Rab3 GTPase-activating protein catalytic subunit n=1 Tax=Nibea albiflora TaxID=240163 RepID=A0ACB7F2Z4_NIBAL|nr:Rab3 GTPase-activating protein catalytic subunit [Nibea albiflora]